MLPRLRSAVVQSGKFTVFVETTSRGPRSWRFISDIAPVFRKFKGQRFSNLVGWLSRMNGYVEITPLN